MSFRPFVCSPLRPSFRSFGRRSLRTCCLASALGLLFLAPATRAQSLNGALSDDTTGPVTPGVHQVTGSLTVAAGKMLTIQPGAILKFNGVFLIGVTGTLHVNGTALAPVVFTTIKDDTAGGDTNGDGNSTAPAPGAWMGLMFHAGSGASVVDHADIRYATTGVNTDAPTAGLTVSNSSVRHGSGYGMNFAFGPTHPSVSHCQIDDNALVAITNIDLNEVPAFLDNSASGNAGGNVMFINGTTINSSITIGPHNILGGSLVMAGNIAVNTGGTLHLLPGTHIKFGGTAQVNVNGGAVDWQGTAVDPIVLTSAKDDTIDGDSNADGVASVPGNSDWLGINVSAAAAPSTISHLLQRWFGYGGSAGLYSNSPLLSLHDVRTEHSAFWGFWLQDLAGPGTDLVAWNCGSGFVMQGGAFNLLRCTSAGNSGVGFIRNAPAWTGSVHSSIAWANGTDVSAFNLGQWIDGDGSVTFNGLLGNIVSDPKFTDLASGDLTLQPTSPCIDAGDPADAPTGLDIAGFPRLMDGNLDKLRVVDMGAHEFDRVHLALSGTLTPGGSMTFTTTGTAGLSTYLFIGVVPTEAAFKTFGPLFVNLGAPYILVAWLPVPSTLPIAIPADLPVPLPLVVQELGLASNMSTSAGNLSNPVFATIQ